MRRKNNKKQKTDTVIHNKRILHEPLVSALTYEDITLSLHVPSWNIQKASIHKLTHYLWQKLTLTFPFCFPWIIISFTQVWGSKWTLTLFLTLFHIGQSDHLPQKKGEFVAKYFTIYVHDLFFITLQLQFFFVLQNKIIKWAAFFFSKERRRQFILKMAVIDWWETQVVKDGG